ncbi:MAG: hypothetical protein AAGB16_09265 [Pseudomonadota bacterium]
MSSDFKTIRADLQGHKTADSSGQMTFIALLVAVLAIGGVIGYMMLPSGSNTHQIAVAEKAEPQKPKAKKLKKSQLKKMRHAELRKFLETQGELRSCAMSQRHLTHVYQSYTKRNQAKYEAWNTLFYPGQKLSDLGKDMNALEGQAYMLGGGMQNDVKDIFSDIEMELNAYNKKIDPIKCGQLNTRVQRRELDLADIPTS